MEYLAFLGNFSLKGELMIQKYFSYTGRLNRLRYFFRILVVMILASVLGTLLAQITPYLAYPVSAIATVSAVMLGIRRCHDLDRSGWFYLLMFIPIIDFFVALYLLFAAGTPGPNQYGADPLDSQFAG